LYFRHGITRQLVDEDDAFRDLEVRQFHLAGADNPGFVCRVTGDHDRGHALSRFGAGDIRDVTAPESANNSSRAGALIPAVAFGIPGSLGAAILLRPPLILALVLGTRAFENAQPRLFPMTVVLIAMPLAALVFVNETRVVVTRVRASGGLRAACAVAARQWHLPESLRFFAYVLAILRLTYVAGQLVALPLFVALYTRRRGTFGWRFSLACALGTLAVIWLVYGKVMNLTLYPSLLFG